jgi:hypothetical protein
MLCFDKNVWNSIYIYILCNQCQLDSTCSSDKFLGAFAKLRKVTTSFIVSVCLSVRMGKLGSIKRIFIKLIFEYFSKVYGENWSLIKVSTRIVNTWHEDVCTLMAITRWILLRIRNFPDEICRQDQNTFYVQQRFSSKSCRLLDNMEKIW